MTTATRVFGHAQKMCFFDPHDENEGRKPTGSNLNLRQSNTRRVMVTCYRWNSWEMRRNIADFEGHFTLKLNNLEVISVRLFWNYQLM